MLWEAKESYFSSFDNTELFYRSWKPKVQSNKAIILIHRGHEHSGRLSGLIKDLGLSDFWFFGWDARGHGRSPGERGNAESVSHLVKDLDSFVKYLSNNYKIPEENIVIVANSIGGVVASAWVHDYGSKIRCMVLAAPAFKIKLYVPFAIPLLRLLNVFKKDAFVKSYVKSTMLTHDKDEADAYDNDPLISKQISVKVLLGFYDLSKRILKDAGAITIPTQIVTAGSDYVVHNKIQRKFLDGIRSKKKEIYVFPKFFHAILYEREKHLPIGKIKEFIISSFKDDVSNEFLVHSDKEGYTKDEYDVLNRRTNLLKMFYFSMMQLSMRTIGRLSKGISLGWKTGFDSGITLDYVYKNKPQGFPIIGQIIDYFYLNSVGWNGIRQRKIHLMKLIDESINAVLKKKEDVHVMDVASGPGRYLLEAVSQSSKTKKTIHVHLRDNQQDNLDEGIKLAKLLNVKNVTFNLGDAFNEEEFDQIESKVDIVVVSGLYELFPGNENIISSLNGISKVLNPNGYLIYTGQPWHPQIEMIARTLINRNKKPWIMRRRTQAEIDKLVESHGFKKKQMLIDSNGIFTVSVAQKG